MWTKKKLDKAATWYTYGVIFNKLASGDEYCYSDIKNAFLAGCKYIINNTQKETEK